MSHATVRALYNSVVFTLIAAGAVGCADRVSPAVRNPLRSDRYNEPRGNAYDVEAWARTMTERDQRMARRILRWKARLTARAQFDFFPEGVNSPGTFPVRNWDAARRAAIRDDLTRILAATRDRAAFHDDGSFAAEDLRVRRLLKFFTTYDNLPEVR